MGKKDAPEADPRIGEAALKSASTGEQYLEMMRGMSDTSLGWATEDRARFRSQFLPLESRLVSDAATYASPERTQAAITGAVADVRQNAALQEGARARALSAAGVSPDSGRYAAEARRADAGTTLAATGAGNLARRQVEAVSDAKVANAVNLGRGNAASAVSGIGTAGSLGSSGFQGAMGGYGQMGSLLNTQYQQQMASHESNMRTMGGIGGAVGSLAGAFLLSSKEAKTNKRQPEMSVLDAVRDMPVEQWSYKDGMGDGGGRDHIGPYAEDFQRATGLGDGQTISIVDAIGVNMRATQELADKVDRIEAAVTGGRAEAAGPPAPRRQPPRQSQRTAPVGREMSIMGVA